MKKALIYASVASMIEQFNQPNIHLFKKLGYEVTVACNFTNGSSMPADKVSEFREELTKQGIKTYDIPIPRSPLKLISIIRAYNMTKKMIEDNGFDKVHCHSPIGGLVCRLAARKSRKKRDLEMIYTAHGFHFFKGAPLKNWFLFYPIEWLCSFFTDKLILLNEEDYERAEKKFHAKKIFLLHGVGVNLEKTTQNVDENQLRNEFDCKKNDFLLFSVGELNNNKNQIVILEALKELKNQNIKYFICGRGQLESILKEYVHENNLGDRVHFLGYRSDIRTLLPQMNCFVMPSKREGLPVSLIEAMSAGLPAIGSNIRGNSDLIQANKGGLLVPATNSLAWKNAIEEVSRDADLCREFSTFNLKFVKQFGVVPVMIATEKIYEA